MIKAVIFDMGGVMIQLKMEDLYQELASRLGIEASRLFESINKYKNKSMKGHISAEELIDKMASDLHVKNSILLKTWEDVHNELSIFDKDMIGIVKSLQSKGYKTALLTNAAIVHAVFKKKHDFYKIFDPVIVSSEVGMEKPEEGIYKLALDKLQLEAGECIFIDDMEEHLLPARILGMKTIHFKNVDQFKRELRELSIEF